MKFFLDSAKLDEIQEAYHTFGIDGVTTNPRHIMASGKTWVNSDALAAIAVEATRKAIVNAVLKTESAYGLPAANDIKEMENRENK